MKINGAMWFTQMGNTKLIGIVFGIDENTGEKKAYIGSADGFDEKADTKNIATTGAKLTQYNAGMLSAFFET